MKRNDLLPLLLVLLAQGMWVSAGCLLEGPDSDLVVALPASAGLLVCALVVAAARVSRTAWLYAGPIAGALSLLPAAVVDSLPVRMTLLGTPAIAILFASVLLSSGLNVYERIERRSLADGADWPAVNRRERMAVVLCLGLSALLLVTTLRELHWLTVWGKTWGDTTDLVGFCLFGSVLAATASGLTLSVTLPEQTRLAALVYPVVVLALMLAVSANAQHVDVYELTEKRAQRVTEAIQNYHARNGRYPTDLGQLTPWHALRIPGPVIVYGQAWSYDGGDDHYRLGYVHREVWRDPPTRLNVSSSTGRTYSTAGEISHLPSICAEVMTDLEDG